MDVWNRQVETSAVDPNEHLLENDGTAIGGLHKEGLSLAVGKVLGPWLGEFSVELATPVELETYVRPEGRVIAVAIEIREG
jgi:hypothetical protein